MPKIHNNVKSKIKYFLKWLIILYFILCYYTGGIFYEIVLRLNPLPEIMSGIIVKKHLKANHGQKVKINHIVGCLLIDFDLYNSGFIDVDCYIKDHPEISFNVNIDKRNLTNINCGYERSLFQYKEKTEFQEHLIEAIGDNANYNVDWKFSTDYWEDTTYGIDSKNIDDITMKNFQNKIDGCIIYIYLNVLLNEYTIDYEKVFNFISYYKETFPETEAEIIIRVKSDEKLTSKEIVLPFYEIHSADDVKTLCTNN